MNINKIRSLIVFLTLSAAFTACYGKVAVSSIPHFNSPSGWPNEAAAEKNNEGVEHLLQSHWDVAVPFFNDAIALSAQFPEPHFNLGVALDGMGKHDEAKEAFKKAKAFGSDDPRIIGHDLLKKHLAT